MSHINIEFKAKVKSLDYCESKLLSQNHVFIGEDRQIDTYYHTNNGRLKLREGNIENALIYYVREDIGGSKESRVILYQVEEGKQLKQIIQNAMGVKAIVDKVRRIYFVENVKIHFDEVKGLGKFLEVEAIDKDGSIGREALQKQCDHFADFFEVEKRDFMTQSYSDMVMNEKDNSNQ
jgi:predicted adenylyl cyclase CyaB